MAHSALSALVALASLTLVAGQTTSAPAAPAGAVPTFPATPLTAIRYPYSAVPYQVYPSPVVRGSQSGYNQCNSTTENQNSLCQTLIVNSISDFCIWAPPTPNSDIADTEGIEVAWCTKKGHGTRGIPPGTFTGLQVLVNSNYVQYVGFINQPNVYMQANDSGGELDSGGQDEAGNPMGGLVYTDAFSSDNTTLDQAPWWTEFIGGGIVALKVCNPSGPNPTGYCQHTLDRIGIEYNMPNNAVNGTFEVCDSDAMDIPGVYTSGSQTLSYAQPAETVPIGTLPYTPRIPSSSNCQTYQSSALFTDFASLVPSTTAASSVPTGSGAKKSGASGAGSASATPTSGSNGAGAVTVSLFSSILGVAFSVAFLA